MAGKASVRAPLINFLMRNGDRDSRLNNFSMAIGRDIIASINKAIGTEGLSLTTKTLTSFNSQSYVAEDRQNLLLPQER